MTDDQLLAACEFAGSPGTPSHKAARRLYRRSVREWRRQDRAWRLERAETLEHVTADAVAIVATVVREHRRRVRDGARLRLVRSA